MATIGLGSDGRDRYQVEMTNGIEALRVRKITVNTPCETCQCSHREEVTQFDIPVVPSEMRAFAALLTEVADELDPPDVPE